MVVLILAKGQSSLIYGTLVSFFLFSYSFLQTFFSYLSTRLGRRKLLVLGFPTASLSFLVLGFTNDIRVSALLLLLAGIAGSTYHPNGMPLRSGFFREDRGQAADFHQTGGSLGSVIAPFLLTGTTMLNLDWKTTLTILAIPGLVASLVIWLFLKELEVQVQNESLGKQAGKKKFNISL